MFGRAKSVDRCSLSVKQNKVEDFEQNKMKHTGILLENQSFKKDSNKSMPSHHISFRKRLSKSISLNDYQSIGEQAKSDFINLRQSKISYKSKLIKAGENVLGHSKSLDMYSSDTKHCKTENYDKDTANSFVDDSCNIKTSNKTVSRRWKDSKEHMLRSISFHDYQYIDNQLQQAVTNQQQSQTQQDESFVKNEGVNMQNKEENSKEKIIKAGRKLLERTKSKDASNIHVKEIQSIDFDTGNAKDAINQYPKDEYFKEKLDRSKFSSKTDSRRHLSRSKSLFHYKSIDAQSMETLDRYSIDRQLPKGYKDQRRNALCEEDIFERKGLVYILNQYSVNCYLENIF